MSYSHRVLERELCIKSAGTIMRGRWAIRGEWMRHISRCAASGKAAMWIDATSGAGPLYNKSQSQVSDKVAFANAPIQATPNGAHWLWSWAFAIPKAAKNAEGGEKFALWATSKPYISACLASCVPTHQRQMQIIGRKRSARRFFRFAQCDRMSTS